MNFSDYINKSTPLAHDLHESEDLHEAADKPLRKFTPKITLDILDATIKMFDSLNGHMYNTVPLAMKQKNSVIYFVWYDEDEDSYCINDFTIRSGVGPTPVESDIPTLAAAKRML